MRGGAGKDIKMIILLILSCIFAVQAKSWSRQVTSVNSPTGQLDIQTRIISPSPGFTILYDSDVSYDGSYDGSVLENEGDYRVCFSNHMSTWAVKTIWFEVKVKETDDEEDYQYEENEYIDDEEMAGMVAGNENDATLFDLSVDEIRGSVQKVRIGVGKIRHFQLMFGASMNADTHQASSNIEKINFWSFIHLILILLVGLVQMSVGCFPWQTKDLGGSDGSLYNQDEEKRDFGMRRSASEIKLTKKKKDERKDKSRSVHFDDGSTTNNISIIGERENDITTDTSRTGNWNFKTMLKRSMSTEDPVLNPENRMIRKKDGSLDEGFESCSEGVQGRATKETRNPEKELNQAKSKDILDENHDKDNDEVKDVEYDTITSVEVSSKVEGVEIPPAKPTRSSIWANGGSILNEIPLSYYSFDFTLICGKDLLAMDKGGTSDPYVVILKDQQQLYRSAEVKKTINPVWEETKTLYLDSLSTLTLQVFDKDTVGKDDFMGQSVLQINTLEINKKYDLCLELEFGDSNQLRKKAKKAQNQLGRIELCVTLTSITKLEYNQGIRSMKNINSKDFKATGVVHVVLVQARSVKAMDHGNSSDPYCKVSLGKEKRKSRVCSSTLNPKWREALDFYWFEEFTDFLEIQVWDQDVGEKDDYMGRVDIDLRELRHEVSHNLWREIQEGEGSLNVIITISGTSKKSSPSNLDNFDQACLQHLEENFTISNSFRNIQDVGRMIVKVLKAEGLASADIGGASDPFAVLELVNQRVQTETKNKTLNPTWQKVFIFDVLDIHDVLEITVYDEDKDHKFEFLGKLMLPLLRIESGRRRWFTLKDRTMRRKAKGAFPQILLELHLFWNPIRASIRTLNPKQLKYEDRSDIKFKFSTFNKNVNRVKTATAGFDPEILARELTSILNWENKLKTSVVFLGYLLGVYFFQPWMITFGLLVPFIQNLAIRRLTGGGEEEKDLEEENQEENNSTKAEEEKKSIKEKMQAMQEIALTIQNHLGFLAHALECVKNVFNFSVPFISWLAFVLLAIITVVLYMLPVRLLLILWGVNKFI
ncbi:multiple C2 and transmembrane domain-containing protein isoform X2 [Eurytemora carolleeae]|uniref:multiple C2 and transmembrane domain-containing protein isoform X2 n=1 Tax=Eurytemora carolleeae TaxID=1294199 RepID=UPI000C767D54|nr:multiple C2 and transmembrane domain-containing protein isoform X2 [Eurytemora carolleeae]|eukprot:XP_023320595.1 multiple C2 and transmembrane domain-containing protein-like isoform X2 [Eurytemora affinis]